MLPEAPGTYVLILRLPQPTAVSVGKLGDFTFPTGWYAYVGSAQGPGGLAARISRHLRGSKSCHWHIDYLRLHAEPVSVWYTASGQKVECKWAQALSELPGASTPVSDFGSSDCRCPAHLFWFPRHPDLVTFARSVDSSISEKPLQV